MSGAPASLWRNGTFLRLWLAQTVSLTGSAVTMVALPLIAVSTLHATPQQMGLLVAAEIAPSLLLRVPAAAWADASRRRIPVMVGCGLANGLLVATVPVLWWAEALSFEWLVGLALCMSAVATVSGMFATPLLPAVVGEEQLVEANGKFSATRSLADVSGRSLGGVLVGLLSAPLALLLDAVSYLAAAVLTMGVRVPPQEVQEPTGSTGTLRGLTLGFRLLLQRPLLGVGVTITGYLCLANGVVSALLVLYMSEHLGLPASLIGPIFGVGAAGGIMAGVLIGAFHRRLGTQRTLAVAVVLLTASFAQLPLARPGAWGVVACLGYELLGSFGAALLLITIFSEVPRQVPPHTIARVIAVISLMPEAAMMVGALVGGKLGSVLGLPQTLAGCFAFTLLADAVLVLWLGWRRRALPKSQTVEG